MPKLKYDDGTGFKQIVPTKKEFDEHLADLASQEVGKGASLIGLNDSASKFVATNVEGAMSELFTNVSSGKQLVGGAIADVDDSVVIPADPTFNDLASAIRNISTGKKFASGTANPLAGANFTILDGSKEIFSRITVTGLDFEPSVIISIRYAVNRYVTMTTYINNSVSNVYPRLIAVSSFDTTVPTTNYSRWIKGDISPANVTYGGFTIPIRDGNTTPPEHWFAFE